MIKRSYGERADLCVRVMEDNVIGIRIKVRREPVVYSQIQMVLYHAIEVKKLLEEALADIAADIAENMDPDSE